MKTIPDITDDGFDTAVAKSPPEVEMDVSLSLRRGYSISLDNETRKAQYIGPKRGLKFDLTTSHEHAHKFDESGRVEELWARRDAIRSLHLSLRDRMIQPGPELRKRIAGWNVEDADRVALAKAHKLDEFHFLGAGPVVLNGRKYREPEKDEKVPADQAAVIKKIQERESAAKLGAGPALVEALTKALQAGVPVGAK